MRALVALADVPPGSYCGAAVIADATGAPPNYLGKLLQQLSRHGLVESQKGLGGGFRLARDARDISLYEIVAAIEDIGRWSVCFLGSPTCSEENPCAVHDRWGGVRDGYLDLLKQTCVADLVPGSHNDNRSTGH